MALIWTQFAACALVILFAGSRLSRYGELIAEKSGLSKNFVSLLLLAMIASSAQLVASVSAVVFHDLPDMAVGALMGSCMFNMLVIGLLDLFSRHTPVSNMVHNGHVLSAGFGIVLVGLGAVDIVFGKNLPTLNFLNMMDPITIAFIPIYLIALRMTYYFEKSRMEEDAQQQALQESNKHVKPSWLRIILGFGFYAVLILTTSSYLPTLAESIQKATSWGQSFMGLSFIAITTCLPEIAVSTSAARRGSYDIAVASLLGSNLFYMVILAITDCCYARGPLLRHVSTLNALAAMTAIISMAIVVIALTYRSERKFLFIAGDAVALVAVYILASVMIFMAH